MMYHLIFFRIYPNTFNLLEISYEKMFFAIIMSILLLMIDLYDTVVFAMDLQYEKFDINDDIAIEYTITSQWSGFENVK